MKHTYTTCRTNLLIYLSKLSCLAYDDPSNLLEQVRRAQFSWQMTPVVYQNGSQEKSREYGSYIGVYGHAIPLVGSSGPFWWISTRCGNQSIVNGLQRLVGFWLTNEQQYQKKNRMMQAMECLSLGAWPSPPYAKETRSLDIFWEWKLPGETY